MVSDEGLVQQVRRGEMGAFDELYRRYNRRLLGYIRRYVHDRATAEDLVQEVFITVLRDRAAFGPGNGRFAGWLFTVARNRCLTSLRDVRRDLEKRERLGQVAGEATADAPPERSHGLRRVLAGLPPAQQEALMLKQVGELTYREIAEIQGIPEGTVKSRLHLAIRALQQGLAQLGGNA